MSIHATSIVKSSRIGSTTGKAIMLILADYADDAGRCWPSVPRIAAETEQSPRNVQRHLKELEERNLLTRIPRKGTSVYLLNFENFTAIDYPKISPSGDNLSPHLEVSPAVTSAPPAVTPTASGVTSATSSSDTSVTLTVIEPPEEHMSEFSDNHICEEIWKHYPSPGRRRSSKQQLKNQWKRINPNNRPDLETILSSIEKWKLTPDWQKENGQFVPGVHLYIQRKKWLDIEDLNTPQHPTSPVIKQHVQI